MYFYIKNLLKSKNKLDIMTEFGKISKDLLLMENKYQQAIKFQERLNLKHLTPDLIRLHKNNPNMLKTNSEDYLTYYMKQAMKNR